MKHCPRCGGKTNTPVTYKDHQRGKTNKVTSLARMITRIANGTNKKTTL